MTTHPVSSSAGSTLTAEVNPAPKQQLGQDEFLKLLTTQLTTQDPLNPMTDTQYISQMANFTSLEQMRALKSEFQQFSAAQAIVSAQNFLGKTVTFGTDTSAVTGIVSEVRIDDGVASLIVNGTKHDPASVTRILNHPTATPPQ